MTDALPDDAPPRSRWFRTVIPTGTAYLVIGIVTATLASSATSPQSGSMWRLVAWGASLFVFSTQLFVERVRLDHKTLTSALHAAAAVALGTFALAAWGPVRTHWGTDSQQRALIALLLWPALTGLVSFLVALGAGTLLGRGRTPGAQ